MNSSHHSLLSSYRESVVRPNDRADSRNRTEKSVFILRPPGEQELSAGLCSARTDMLQDIAVLTGGKLIAEELGIKLETVSLDDLGKARRVVLDKDSTTIIEGGGSKAAIEGRCSDLRKQISKVTSDYDREKMQERLARLAGGVAVLCVGALTEAELKNRKEALDDAISATKAAMAEGIVPGKEATVSTPQRVNTWISWKLA